MACAEDYESRMMEVLKSAEMPLDIENVRKRAGIRNWQTAKALLFELLAQGAVSALKTSKSWIFWVGAAAWLRRRPELEFPAAHRKSGEFIESSAASPAEETAYEPQ